MVSDSVFLSDLVRDGLAIVPDEGVVYSPANGIVANLFPAKHAVGILTDEGLEILVHVRMDMVNLDREGFQSYVKENDIVK